MEFNEAFQRKERGVSVKQILESALAQSDEMDSIALVARYKDGIIRTSYSVKEGGLELLGMLEVSKDQVLETMKDLDN